MKLEAVGCVGGGTWGYIHDMDMDMDMDMDTGMDMDMDMDMGSIE